MFLKRRIFCCWQLPGSGILAAILSRLSTGEVQDLEVVRGVYQKKMADFKPEPAGPQSRHNGYQDIAAAMQIASKAEKGKTYAMATEKCAQNPLYTYRGRLNGQSCRHTS